MTKREITHLCFKLLGAYALLLAVADTRGFAYVLTMSPGGSDEMVSHLVAAFGPLILLTLSGCDPIHGARPGLPPCGRER